MIQIKTLPFNAHFQPCWFLKLNSPVPYNFFDYVQSARILRLRLLRSDSLLWQLVTRRLSNLIQIVYKQRLCLVGLPALVPDAVRTLPLLSCMNGPPRALRQAFEVEPATTIVVVAPNPLHPNRLVNALPRLGLISEADSTFSTFLAAAILVLRVLGLWSIFNLLYNLILLGGHIFLILFIIVTFPALTVLIRQSIRVRTICHNLFFVVALETKSLKTILSVCVLASKRVSLSVAAAKL